MEIKTGIVGVCSMAGSECHAVAVHSPFKLLKAVSGIFDHFRIRIGTVRLVVADNELRDIISVHIPKCHNRIRRIVQNRELLPLLNHILKKGLRPFGNFFFRPLFHFHGGIFL